MNCKARRGARSEDYRRKGGAPSGVGAPNNVCVGGVAGHLLAAFVAVCAAAHTNPSLSLPLSFPSKLSLACLHLSSLARGNVMSASRLHGGVRPTATRRRAWRSA